MPVHGSFYHWAANNKPIMSSVTTGIHLVQSFSREKILHSSEVLIPWL